MAAAGSVVYLGMSPLYLYGVVNSRFGCGSSFALSHILTSASYSKSDNRRNTLVTFSASQKSSLCRSFISFLILHHDPAMGAPIAADDRSIVGSASRHPEPAMDAIFAVRRWLQRLFGETIFQRQTMVQEVCELAFPAGSWLVHKWSGLIFDGWWYRTAPSANSARDKRKRGCGNSLSAA